MRLKHMFLLIAVFLCASNRAEAAGSSPRVLTEQVVATFQRINDPNLSATERLSGANTHALDAFFDFDALSAAAVKSHRKALGPKQSALLQSTFRALLTVLTHKSGEKLVGGDVVVGAPYPQGSNCAVDFEVSHPQDDVKSKVTLTWHARANSWSVVDVAFDDASVIKDYENQFGRIIKKEGSAALISKLKTRLAQATAQAK